jgi:hypothetical protein
MAFTDLLWSEAPSSLRESWKMLGAGIKTLPLGLWEPNMLFSGAPDDDLKALTGHFPAVIKSKHSTHPLFVLKRKANFGITLCPCTSRKSKARYIEKGCCLEVTAKVTDRRSFILEQFAFSISANFRLGSRIRFMGIVPDKCIGMGR